VTHVLLAATSIGFAENPTMNRFVVGRRLYQRDGVHMTFSMKRRKLDKKSKIAVVKMEFLEEGESFRGLCERIDGRINYQRSDEETYLDKELNLLDKIPRFFLNLGIAGVRWLDYHNILPMSFIKGDGMYTSMFIANLGSLQMGAGFHHLYEWGTCPLFLMVGAIEEKPVAVDGELEVGKVLHLRYSYDERIDDGLTARHGMDTAARVLEDPKRYLGCLDEDGSDAIELDEYIVEG
jgi:hypothetical protein